MEHQEPRAPTNFNSNHPQVRVRSNIENFLGIPTIEQNRSRHVAPGPFYSHPNAHNLPYTGRGTSAMPLNNMEAGPSHAIVGENGPSFYDQFRSSTAQPMQFNYHYSLLLHIIPDPYGGGHQHTRHHDSNAFQSNTAQNSHIQSSLSITNWYLAVAPLKTEERR